MPDAMFFCPQEDVFDTFRSHAIRTELAIRRGHINL